GLAAAEVDRSEPGGQPDRGPEERDPQAEREPERVHAGGRIVAAGGGVEVVEQSEPHAERDRDVQGDDVDVAEQVRGTAAAVRAGGEPGEAADPGPGRGHRSSSMAAAPVSGSTRRTSSSARMRAARAAPRTSTGSWVANTAVSPARRSVSRSR